MKGHEDLIKILNRRNGNTFDRRPDFFTRTVPVNAFCAFGVYVLIV
jgi:hypothetical protein